MNILNLLARIYVSFFRFRERSFGYTAEFEKLPEDYDHTRFPAMLDIFWLLWGFVGREVAYAPKGFPCSARYDEKSDWWQSWAGHYFITALGPVWFKNEITEVEYFANAAIRDQKMWLRLFGVRNGKVILRKNSIKKVLSQNLKNGMEQNIFRGEIFTEVDDAVISRKSPWVLGKIADEITKLYNNSKPTVNLRLDNTRSQKKSITLFGYWSMVKVSGRKYIVSYASIRRDASLRYRHELLETVKSVQIG